MLTSTASKNMSIRGIAWAIFLGGLPFAPFLYRELSKVSSATGLWHVQTDHEEYFQVIRDLLDRHPSLRQVPFDSDESAAPNTNFEIKYVRDGRTIYRFAVKKQP
ncbi:MAG: hypothetical protein IH988_00560 [Planctomycetes bacterium]|nr:hypothetical protein [Planctomycetota bacterium]